MMRAGRMLAQGDLRLLALALIAEQPRHGYEIIKVLEDKTEGWYAPSPASSIRR
jgi:DNA-binding PadR family transcriptional regulator